MTSSLVWLTETTTFNDHQTVDGRFPRGRFSEYYWYLRRLRLRRELCCSLIQFLCYSLYYCSPDQSDALRLVTLHGMERLASGRPKTRDLSADYFHHTVRPRPTTLLSLWSWNHRPTILTVFGMTTKVAWYYCHRTYWTSSLKTFGLCKNAAFL